MSPFQFDAITVVYQPAAVRVIQGHYRTKRRITEGCQSALSSRSGGLAQMVERVLSMHEAQGSIPWFSTFFFAHAPL